MMLSLTTSLYAQSNAKLGDLEYVKIYPNPITTEATIRLNDVLDLNKSKVSITFYNVVGKEVLKLSNIKDSEVRFNRDNLSTGMYIYQLKVDDRTQSTGRVVIK